MRGRWDPAQVSETEVGEKDINKASSWRLATHRGSDQISKDIGYNEKWAFYRWNRWLQTWTGRKLEQTLWY